MRGTLFLLSFVAATATAAPAPPAAPSAVEPCPYNVGELASTLGMSFKAGIGKSAPVPGGVQTTCTYAPADGYMTLILKQTVMAPADHQRGADAFARTLTSPLLPIQGDADGASWQMDPYSPNNVALHYLRGTHRIELRAQGGVKKAAVLQPKLFRLRRLP
jgi:hypothetical protein